MNEVEIVRHRQVEGLSLFINTVELRTPHSHPEWELIWLLDGVLCISCGASSRLLQPGQLALFAPNEVHEIQKTAGSGTFLCLQLAPALCSGLGGAQQRLTLPERYPHEQLSPAELHTVCAALADAADAYFSRRPQYPLYCLGQCCLALHRLLTRLPVCTLTPEEAAAADRRTARWQRIVRYVDENYMHKLKLADLAQQEGCSLSYLSHFIRQTIGMTFQDYVSTVRFNSACKLIADTDMRLLDICVAAGFSDYRYFCRIFRQQYGLTPEEYRRAGHTDRTDTAVRRSLHTVEHIHTTEESQTLLRRFFPHP